MAMLAESVPPFEIPADELKRWGNEWLQGRSFSRQQSVNFARFIDRCFADFLASMLGGIPTKEMGGPALIPPLPDCVEIGDVRVIGGVRPQNFDVVYRPDGPRVVFDSKTLNDEKSIRKNWQNMVNDLATEATTVHTRFPFAIVAFAIVIPRPALPKQQEVDMIRTLERLGTRKQVLDQPHLAEAISLVIWDPGSGTIDGASPASNSVLRVEKFPEAVYTRYLERYKGLPPHNIGV